MQYKISDPLLLEIDIENFEYEPGHSILHNIKKSVYNVLRPDISQGQIISILGPSGIGKSTLFELMAGLLKPNKGCVKTYDKKENSFKEVEVGEVGMVYQNYELYPFMTVKGLLNLGAQKGGFQGSEASDKINYYLTHFHLMTHAHKYPNQLSGGQRQRLAIAQQLLCSNTILLMDEPFSGLDPLTKNSVCELITDVASLDELMTIILVSHDITAALSISDTVWLMGRNKTNGSATIVETIDLMEKGLAWQKDIEHNPEFLTLCRDVKDRFKELV